MPARTIGSILFCVLAGAWLSRAVFGWILDFDGSARWAFVGAGALLGLVVGIAGTLAERRGDGGSGAGAAQP